MRTVWKFTLDLANGVEHTLKIPGGGRFRYLKDQPYVMLELREEGIMPKIDTWWEVDTFDALQTVQLQLIGTGFEVPENARYLGTAFPIPNVVLHLWDILQSSE